MITREIFIVISGMVYHFSDLFQYITDSKEDLAEWQVKNRIQLCANWRMAILPKWKVAKQKFTEVVKGLPEYSSE